LKFHSATASLIRSITLAIICCCTSNDERQKNTEIKYPYSEFTCLIKRNTTFLLEEGIAVDSWAEPDGNFKYEEVLKEFRIIESDCSNEPISKTTSGNKPTVERVGNQIFETHITEFLTGPESTVFIFDLEANTIDGVSYLDEFPSQSDLEKLDICQDNLGHIKLKLELNFEQKTFLSEAYAYSSNGAFNDYCYPDEE